MSQAIELVSITNTDLTTVVGERLKNIANAIDSGDFSSGLSLLREIPENKDTFIPLSILTALISIELGLYSDACQIIEDNFLEINDPSIKHLVNQLLSGHSEFNKFYQDEKYKTTKSIRNYIFVFDSYSDRFRLSLDKNNAAVINMPSQNLPSDAESAEKIIDSIPFLLKSLRNLPGQSNILVLASDSVWIRKDPFNYLDHSYALHVANPQPRLYGLIQDTKLINAAQSLSNLNLLDKNDIHHLRWGCNTSFDVLAGKAMILIDLFESLLHRFLDKKFSREDKSLLAKIEILDSKFPIAIGPRLSIRDEDVGANTQAYMVIK